MPSDDAREVVVQRDAVPVMFRRVAYEQSVVSRAWAELEDLVGSLQGRNFYGAYDPREGEYRVCVQLREGDRPAALGLEVGALPGGRYARVRVHGEPPGVYKLIAPTFEKMASRPDHDTTRPSLEFYRRRNQIDLLLPVA